MSGSNDNLDTQLEQALTEVDNKRKILYYTDREKYISIMRELLIK